MKEITEVEQNAWREEKRKSQKLESRGKRNIPEGWIRRSPALDNKEIERRAKKLQTEQQWDKITTCREYIEKHEGWICTTWLERSSHEEERRMRWEKTEKQPRRTALFKEIHEMQTKKGKTKVGMQKDEMRDDYSKKAGKGEMAGKS